MEIKNDGGLLELMRVGDGGLLEAIVWGTVPCQPPQKKYKQGKPLLLAAARATD
jgi:hypothetical protein